VPSWRTNSGWPSWRETALRSAPVKLSGGASGTAIVSFEIGRKGKSPDKEENCVPSAAQPASAIAKMIGLNPRNTGTGPLPGSFSPREVGSCASFVTKVKVKIAIERKVLVASGQNGT
jgi:hypothetical protein